MAVTGPPDICTCSLLPVRGAMSGAANVSCSYSTSVSIEVGLGVLLCYNNNAFLAPGVWNNVVAVLCIDAQCIDAQRRAVVLEQRSDLRQNNWVSLEPLPSPWRAIHSPST